MQPDEEKNCTNNDFSTQIHYYELSIDNKLVYRNRLKLANEKDQPTEWQLPLGKHSIRITANGFIPFEKTIEVVKKSESATKQYFGTLLQRNEQGEEKLDNKEQDKEEQNKEK
ncbi:MAG: hypothetical protein D3910_12200 [Candidatus Electrothrix sp. ATG2]|nr:hypothetical protein [Candidatus Electrothrix sp. ATG2]